MQITSREQRKRHRQMTSNGSTLTKCLPEHTGLVLSEILKFLPSYHTKAGKLPKRLLHVNGSRVGLLSLGNSEDRKALYLAI